MPNFLREDYGIRQAMADTAVPTSGTFNQFDMVENSSPSVGNPASWVCVTGGSPGTWKSNGFLPNLTAVTAAGTLSTTSGIAYVSGAGFNTTLAVPSGVDGVTINVVNGASGSTTITPTTGTAILPGSPAAVTLTTNTSATFKAYGTNWYKI